MSTKHISLLLAILLGAYAPSMAHVNKTTPTRQSDRSISESLAKQLYFNSREDSTTFITLYNSYKDKVKAIKAKYQSKNNSIIESEIEKDILNTFAKSQEILNLRKEYYYKFKKILPPHEILKLYEKEKELSSNSNNYVAQSIAKRSPAVQHLKEKRSLGSFPYKYANHEIFLIGNIKPKDMKRISPNDVSLHKDALFKVEWRFSSKQAQSSLMSYDDYIKYVNRKYVSEAYFTKDTKKYFNSPGGFVYIRCDLEPIVGLFESTMYKKQDYKLTIASSKATYAPDKYMKKIQLSDIEKYKDVPIDIHIRTSKYNGYATFIPYNTLKKFKHKEFIKNVYYFNPKDNKSLGINESFISVIVELDILNQDPPQRDYFYTSFTLVSGKNS